MYSDIFKPLQRLSFLWPHLRSGVQDVVSSFFYPPKHVRCYVAGSSVDDCLRKLERKLGLPVFDLSIDISRKPQEMSSFPSGAKYLQHYVLSETSSSWKETGRPGYISCSVNVSTRGLALFSKGVPKLDVFAHAHMSKNCPGVYEDNVCTKCGDVSR